MKFSLAILSAAVTAVSAAKVSFLRAKSSDVEATEVTGQVYVGGLLRVPNDEERLFIDQTIAKAYNKAFEDYDGSIDLVESSDAVLLNQEEGIVMLSTTMTRLGCGYCCRFCPDENDDWDCYAFGICNRSVLSQLSEAELSSVRYGNDHTKFEKTVCKKLRASGIANFAQAKDCSINFLELPGTSELRPSEENAYEAAHGQVMDIQVTMAGVSQELSSTDMKILESAAVEAHAETFQKTGLRLKDIEVDSAVSTDNKTLFLASGIPNIVEDEIPAGKTFKLGYYHHAFEYALCSKLEASGAAAFANVDDCSFTFVYNPAKEAGAALAKVGSEASE